MTKMKKIGKPHGQFKIHAKGHLSLKMYFIHFSIPELKEKRRISKKIVDERKNY